MEDTDESRLERSGPGSNEAERIRERRKRSCQTTQSMLPCPCTTSNIKRFYKCQTNHFLPYRRVLAWWA